MSLDKKEFDVLVNYEKRKDGDITQREISQEIGHSLGTVNKIINDLIKKGYIYCKRIFKRTI